MTKQDLKSGMKKLKVKMETTSFIPDDEFYRGLLVLKDKALFQEFCEFYFKSALIGDGREETATISMELYDGELDHTYTNEITINGEDLINND